MSSDEKEVTKRFRMNGVVFSMMDTCGEKRRERFKP